MTTFEIAMAIVGALIVPMGLYVARYVNKLKDEIDKLKDHHNSDMNEIKNKIHDLEVKSIAGDELTKKHIINCENYKPRHKID